MLSGRLVALAILCSTVISGCIAESATPGLGTTAQPTLSAAPPGAFDDTTGAVTGLVVNEELQPIPTAEVALADTEFRTRAALDGSFSFSHVPPGEYLLQSGALGYTSAAQVLSVGVGEVTTARVQLAALPVFQPRVDLYVFEGYITCTVGMFGVLSEECGQGLQTDVGTYGTNPNNKIDWKWNVTDVKNLETMVIEMDWEPGSAAAAQLTLYVAHGFRCTPSCTAEGGEEYCDTDNHGPPVQVCRIDDLKINNADTDLPWDMTSRAWGAPVEATEVPNIVLEQAFTMYRTEFFGMPMESGYSAIPDA
jgi:carboxypeptidase family protein